MIDKSKREIELLKKENRLLRNEIRKLLQNQSVSDYMEELDKKIKKLDKGTA